MSLCRFVARSRIQRTSVIRTCLNAVPHMEDRVAQRIHCMRARHTDLNTTQLQLVWIRLEDKRYYKEYNLKSARGTFV
jgi:hypothetical protein